MRNGRSAFVLDKLFSTIDGKKGSRIFENQLRGCKIGLASSKANYEVARLVLHLRTPITRLQDWSRIFEHQLRGCKIGLASSKTNYEVARLVSHLRKPITRLQEPIYY